MKLFVLTDTRVVFNKNKYYIFNAVKYELEAIQSLFSEISILGVYYKLVKENNIIKKVTLQQMQDNINFLEAKDMHHTHWKDCVEFNKALDETRKQDFIKTNPEFAQYV